MLVDEEVSYLLNRPSMTRLLYKAALLASMVATASLSFAYVLPTTFIGRVLGERGLTTKFEAIEFTMRSDETNRKSITVKISKSGKVELLEGEGFTRDSAPTASLVFNDDAVTQSGDFSKFPGSAELWSVFLLHFLDAEDADSVEVRWATIAKVLGLAEVQSELSRWNGTVCYELKNSEGPRAARLLVDRNSFQIVQWSLGKEADSAGSTTLKLLDHENSPAPKWVAHILEFTSPGGERERFEVLDVEFHKPQETATP